MPKKKNANSLICELKKKTRRKYSSEEKIRIIIDGMRAEKTIAGLYRKEGLSRALYHKWSKDFIEAGKKRLAGNTMRKANTSEVKETKY